MADNRLYELTLEETLDKLSRGEITSVNLTQAVLDRINEQDDAVRAYICVQPEIALEMAKFRDQSLSFSAFVGALQAVGTDVVAPTTSSLTLNHVTRADGIKPALPVAEALANAPAAKDDQFWLKPVL